ncbi:MAG: cyclic nucleotide-binding domain-containing protein [Gammaproteobacteria bacterium]|nr:cyclic nucleotide-binding domain-containing protein [Gammaproteobacteria bacterium]
MRRTTPGGIPMTDSEKALQQMFPGMSEEDLAELTGVAELHTYPADAMLCQEGQIENTFYAIVSGQVEVIKQLDDETQQVINRPGSGNFVGEIALVQEGPRTATVRTTEPTTVLEIDHSSFVDMLHRSAPMAVRIMLEITPRLRDIDLATIANLRQKNTELMQAYEKLQEQYKELEKQR